MSKKNILNQKKVGLALGGGAILGAAHIGVLKALEEYNIKIDYISGTSIGSFAASLVAFGKNWKDIEDLVSDLNWLDISKVSLSKYGLLDNKRLGELLIKAIGDVNIEDAKIPLHIISTDISSGKKVVFSKGNLARAVMASSSIPGIFIPVKIDGKYLVDGGVVENVPISPLKKTKANFIIGVDLLSQYSHSNPTNIIGIVLNAFNFLISKSAAMKEEDVDLSIKPDLSSFDKFNPKQVSSIIQKGYSEANRVLKNNS